MSKALGSILVLKEERKNRGRGGGGAEGNSHATPRVGFKHEDQSSNPQQPHKWSACNLRAGERKAEDFSLGASYLARQTESVSRIQRFNIQSKGEPTSILHTILWPSCVHKYTLVSVSTYVMPPWTCEHTSRYTTYTYACKKETKRERKKSDTSTGGLPFRKVEGFFLVVVFTG